MRETGRYQKLGSVTHFVPHALPPEKPGLVLCAEIMMLHGEASYALGQLSEAYVKFANDSLIKKAHIFKEAIFSSAIEGIHSSIIDVYGFSLSHTKADRDTRLVVNYANAIEKTLAMLQQQDLPISSRVILHAHEILMSIGKPNDLIPGQFRKQTVRVGNLIPPPAQEIPRLMSDLEKYINSHSDLPPLIQAGLVHVHFETIHPFLDGNGRIGRLIIILMLIENGLLHAPILYPSFYFLKHQSEYYQRLDKVRTHGDYEGWICFYLKAIRESASDANRRIRVLENLHTSLSNLLHTDPAFSKMRDTAQLALDYLFTKPITNITEMSKSVGKAYNTISNILLQFQAQDLVNETIINKRNKQYQFKAYLSLLEKIY